MSEISTSETSRIILSALSNSNAEQQNSSSEVSGNSETVSISNEAHTLILRDKISSTSQLVGFATISGDALDKISTYLLDIKNKFVSLNDLSLSDAQRQQIKSEMNSYENEMSAFIGSLYHDNSLEIGLKTYDTEISNQFLEIIDLKDSSGSDIGSISAIEVNFNELIANVHNEKTCPHCQQEIAKSQANGLIEPELYSTITTSTAGFQSVSNASGDSNQSIIDTLLLGTKWDIDTSSGEELTYSYFDSNTTGYDPNYNGGSGGSGIPVVNGPIEVNTSNYNNENNLNTMFEKWDDVLAIDFSEIDESGGSDSVGELRVAFTDRSSSAAAFAYQPGSNSVNGDIWFESEDNTAFDPTGYGSNGYSFRSALHEVGHAIGLSHPFDGSSVTGQNLSSANDIMRNTFMSYTNIDRNLILRVRETIDGVTNSYTMNDLQSWTRTSGSSISYDTVSLSASTPMPYDILASQFLYGAETDTRSTDTAYSFDVTPYTIQTIYDSDGTDTFDASNQTNASTINLNPGTFSSIGTYTVNDQLDLLDSKGLNAGDTVQTWLSTAYDNVSSALSNDMDINSLLFTGADNVAISPGVYIENAYGGSGNDTITGNNLNNLIIGNGGNDTINGGTGDADIVKFSGDRFDYNISTSSGTTTVVDGLSGRDGTDSLTNVEYLQFTENGGGFLRFNATLQNLTSNVNFKLTIDGVTASVTLAAKDYTGLSLQQFASDLDAAIETAFSTVNNVSVSANSPLTIRSNSSGTNSTVQISSVTDSTLQAALGISDSNGTGSTHQAGKSSVATQYYNVSTGTISSSAPSGAPGPSVGVTYANSGGGNSGASGGVAAIKVISPRKSRELFSTTTIDVSSKEKATSSIETIDIALKKINNFRAYIGSIESKLGYALNSLERQILNTKMAQSRIQDSDFAVELSKLVKNQVLQKAASHVFIQANKAPSTLLSLLK